jgi:capsid protein
MITIIQGGKITQVKNGKQYTGEKIPGDLAKWDFFGTNPNELLTYSYDLLSQRSTTLFHTHAPVASAINKLSTYAIGSGLVFRSQPDWQILGIDKDYAKDWGMRFQKLIHYLSLITNFYEKQSVLFRTAHIQGDSLLFFDRSYDTGNGLFDLIEVGGDYIDFDAQESVLGVRVDKAMRRLGLYLTDGGKPDFKDANGDQNVLHYYDKQMARQMRGYPLAYKIIAACKNNDRWWDATLARAVLEATILGYSNSEDGGDDLFQQANGLAALATEQATGNEPTIRRESGLADQTPGGVYSYTRKGSMHFMDMKAPGNNFDKMQNAFIDICGMAMNIPPEVILSKYSTSYTAHKGAFNDFIKTYKSERENFSRKINKVVIIEFAKYLFLNKMIEIPSPAFFENPIIREATVCGNYLGPVPGHINPAQEVKAKAEEVAQAFRLRSDVAIEYGNDFDNMILEWQQEEAEWNKQNAERQAASLIANMENQDNVNSEDNNDDTGGGE